MDQTIVTLLVALGSAFFGAPLWNFATRWLDRGAEREDKEIGRLREDVKRLSERDRKCEEELIEVKDRLAAVEHHHESHLARWIKDANRRLVWLNSKAYLSIFALLRISKDEVEGKTFEELLDPHAAAEIEKLDRIALAQPGSAASNLIRLHPDLPPMIIVKVAAAGRDGDLIYEGYAYRANDPEITHGVGAERQAEQREASAVHVIDQKQD